MARPAQPPPGLAPATEPRRPALAERLSREVRRLLAPAAKTYGFALADVLVAWPEIVGPDLAARVLPAKLSRPTPGGGGATLTLRCRGSAAIEVQHQVPTILARLNTFQGREAVSRIKITQGDLPVVKRRARPRPRPLAPEAAARLDAALAGINDPGLRGALGRLGAAVMGRAGPDRDPDTGTDLGPDWDQDM